MGGLNGRLLMVKKWSSSKNQAFSGIIFNKRCI
jgi:hypothetical protein